MKKGFFLSVLAFAFLGLLLCCSAQAQTWKELLDQADSLYKAAAYDSATVVAELALDKTGKEFSENDTAVALVLHLLGSCHYRQANYDEAELLLSRALSIMEKAVSSDHPVVAKSLNALGVLCFARGRFSESETFHKRALAIREKTLGSDHPDVATSLTDLANLYGRQGQYAEAESLYQRSLAIRERALGTNNPDVAKSLHNLGILFWEQGKYAKAQPLNKRALAIWQESLGSEHPYVAHSLHNSAIIYVDQGKYGEAERLYERSLQILEKILGRDHPSVSRNLGNIALVYIYQGKYAEAELLYKEVLTRQEEALGSDHPDVATSLGNLALLYKTLGRYAEAEVLEKRALGIREKAFGFDHPHVAHSLQSLANVYVEWGRYREAEPLQERAIAIRETSLGSDHPYVAYSFADLAVLLRKQAKYVEAEPVFKQALAVGHKALGFHHPLIALLQGGLALLFRDVGKYADSQRKERVAFSIRRKNFQEGSEVLSEKDALIYSRFMRNEANQFISILLDSRDTSFNCQNEIAEIVSSTKGQVSDGIFARYRNKVYEKDPNLKPLSDSLRYARFRLSKLYVRGPGEEEPQVYKAELDSVSEEKDRLEAELARRSADFRRELELWEVDAEKIYALLPPKSTLVEYMRFDRLTNGRETEPHYLLVIVDDKCEIFVSDLGLSDEIDSLVTEYRSHLQTMARHGGSASPDDIKDYENVSTQLYKRIWKPVESNLSGADLVFIASDGALNLVSFAGLTDGSGKYLIEKHPIHYLSSGRDLIRLEAEFEPGSGLFALGDPDFDASASARLSSEADLTQTEETDTSLYYFRLRNVRSGCEALNEITVLPLPGTRKEVERVSDAWKNRNDEPCCLFLGAEASEDNFKQNAPGSRIIHLATHGYYAESDCRPELPKSNYGMSEGFVGENPLLLSGLFLAGANLHGEGADSLGIEDGILTAEEVTGMELEGAKWVVLSACESGLGEVKAGEGVYGLRRAFQMAGARTVISALWPVSDKTTAEMMSYLYNFEEDNLALAMQSLAKKKIKELRKRKQPDHPYLWAPFIALGDWR